MKIGLCQLSVGENKQENLSLAATKIKEASEMGSDIVCLPEIFNSPYENSNFEKNAEVEGGLTYKFLSKQAKDNNIYLVGGSIPERDGDQIYNTSYVFDRNGEKLAKHRKVHLFDIFIPGEMEFMESKTLTAGNKITTFETEFGKMAVAICFDIRFSEYFSLIGKTGAKVIFVPAAFNMTTGPAHWDLAFKSRALDNQLFIAGCSPARNEKASYVAYGHSLIVNPWAKIIGKLDEKQGTLVKDIKLEQIEEYRNKLPIVKNARNDLYKTELKR
jgi:predicted amidohydrolase